MTHTFQPLRREPAYLKVYQAIEEEIVSGALAEGALLPTEAELCAQFQVTRSTVREGIRLLEQSGLVERGAAKRLVVKRPHSSDVAEAASLGLALGGATFGEVWETLSTMYPEAARLAAKRLNAASHKRLAAVHDRFSKCAETALDDIVEEAVAFFQCLAAELDNRVLLALLQSLNLMIGASLHQVIQHTPNAKRRIAKAQKEILAAIKAKDGDAAARWMLKHIDDLRRGYAVAGLDMTAPVFLPNRLQGGR